MRCLSVFHSAATALLRHEAALREKSTDHEFTDLQLERTLPKDDWIRALVGGADEQSPRWRHVLVLGGLILGFGAAHENALSRSMRSTLESAFVTATNAAAEDLSPNEALGEETLTMVLNHTFPHLRDHERSQLNYDALFPILMRATLHSSEGLRSAYFLSMLDEDVTAASQSQFQWPERARSFQVIQQILSSPLASSLGPLARLIAHALEHARNPDTVLAALIELESFSRTLYLQWRRTKLSEIDASEESLFLNTATTDTTLPSLWKLLKATLFAVVIVLRSAIGRTLGNSFLGLGQRKSLVFSSLDAAAH
jgi:hypothetical protein